MKRFASISPLILPLLALVFAQGLSAQTLVVDKPTLLFSGQVSGSAISQPINVTSSTGAAIPFTLSYPSYSWLKVNNQLYGINGITPATLSVTADPTGLPAGTVSASILVTGGSSANNAPITVSFTVSAIGVSPASLALTYTVGSSNFPVSQILALSGTPSQCTAAASATSGGNWFTLLQNACLSPGNVTILINNAVVAGLSPNTYNGTVTITPLPAGQSPAVVVPLTLTVAPTPPVTVNPTSLVFYWQTGTAAPNPSQTFTISTSAPQSLNYSFTSAVDAGNWISTISPPNGTFTGSAQITVTVNPNGLAVGTYNGKVTVFTPGGSPAQQDIPVKLIVSNTALLNVPNADVSFFYQIGTSAPASQTVNITATSGLLNYSVSTGPYNPSAITGWLSVPNAGNTGTPLTLSINPAGLAAGTYSAAISVTSATPGSAAQLFKVILKVSNDPIIAASVSALSFPYQIGQATPAARTVSITSSTGVPLNYSASLYINTCPSGWLQATNTSNSLTGVTPDTLTLAVNTTSLISAGTCSATLTINATIGANGPVAVNSPLSIPVTLYVSTTAQLVLTPANLQPFTVSVGSPPTAQQPIVLTSTNSDVLSYIVAFQSTGWLSVNTLGGNTRDNPNLTITVSSAGLAAGTYSGSVTVTATGPGGATVADSPVILPVTLNVSAGSLTLGATDISFPDQTLGGPAPAPQTVTIGSNGQALNYTAVANSNTPVTWLSVSPASGNTSNNGTLTVAVDGSKLTAGTYTGTIVVTSPAASNSPQTITVHFKVNPGTLSAPNTPLTFTQVAGGAVPPAQSIAVTGSPVALNFTVVGNTFNGGNWLSATPASGTTPSTVQVSVNGASLAAGQYTGSVTIASSGAGGSPIAVGVILNVVSPATLAASPTSLAFAYTVGLAVPSAQNLAVTATGGTGNVPITAQVQVDGTATGWLAVTPASGNTPGTFAISVVTSGLAAGKYTGRIVISSPNSLAPVSVSVTLTVTAIPQPVVGSVANAANYSTGAVSPGENIVIFGTGIGPATQTLATVANNVFPTLVGNTRVLFDGVPAPIYYVSAGQTSVFVPYGVSGRTSTSIVVEYSGVQSAPINQSVALAVPGIYTQNASGSGPGSILNHDGLTINGFSAPEKRGNFISIYMTGEGQTTPQGVDGAVIPPVASALKVPLLQVTVTIGGVDAVVIYAGSAAGLISGVMQVNVFIPITAPTGTQPVVVSVGGVKSQTTGASPVTVAVQ